MISKLGSSVNDTNRINESATIPKAFSSVFSAQGNHSLAINEDRELSMPGHNSEGQLGDGMSLLRKYSGCGEKVKLPITNEALY